MTEDRWNVAEYVHAAAVLHGLAVPAEGYNAVVANLRGLHETSRLLEDWREAVGATERKSDKR